MIQSKLLLQFPELIHGYSVRADGDMGMKRLPGDTYDEADEQQWLANRQQIFDELRVAIDRVTLSRQTHSATVELVDESKLGGAERNEAVFSSADGFIVTQPNNFPTVFTADCMPIFFYDPKQKVAAIIHSGWRGTAAGIIAKTVAALSAQGGQPENVVVWIGPHIKVCHYDTDPTIYSYAEKQAAFAHEPGILIEREGKTFIDLTTLAVRQLTEAGVPKEQIEIGDCTACHFDTYFSYHVAENNTDGRMMGVIGVRD